MLISFLVYVSDIFTAVTMLTTDSWSNSIFNSCPHDDKQPVDPNVAQAETSSKCVYIPFSIGRWLFFGCVIFSFLLLAYEAYKAKKIIQSRDISYAFTNVMANKYYSLRKSLILSWPTAHWIVYSRIIRPLLLLQPYLCLH